MENSLICIATFQPLLQNWSMHDDCTENNSKMVHARKSLAGAIIASKLVHGHLFCYSERLAKRIPNTGQDFCNRNVHPT